ncbi:UNVERIFIED_CONTAM: hypothetical protein FKN15_070144 [Acipenser sinensis]
MISSWSRVHDEEKDENSMPTMQCQLLWAALPLAPPYPILLLQAEKLNKNTFTVSDLNLNPIELFLCPALKVFSCWCQCFSQPCLL